MSHLLSQESNGSISVYKDFWDKQIQWFDYTQKNDNFISIDQFSNL